MEIKFIRLKARPKLDRSAGWNDTEPVWINIDKIDSIVHNKEIEGLSTTLPSEHYLITTDNGQFAVIPEEFKILQRQLERIGLWEEIQ